MYNTNAFKKRIYAYIKFKYYVFMIINYIALFLNRRNVEVLFFRSLTKEVFLSKVRPISVVL